MEITTTAQVDGNPLGEPVKTTIIVKRTIDNVSAEPPPKLEGTKNGQLVLGAKMKNDGSVDLSDVKGLLYEPKHGTGVGFTRTAKLTCEVKVEVSIKGYSASKLPKIVTARVAVPIPHPTDPAATYGVIDTSEDPKITNLWEAENIETKPAEQQPKKK